MSLESGWENTCRLCSEEKLEMLKIFGDEGKKRKVAQKLRVCLPVLVYKTDPLPKQICQFCAARLDDIFEFREYCLNVYKKMHLKLLSHKDLNSVNVFLDAMSNSSDPCQVQLCMIKPRAPPPLVPLPSSISSASPNVPTIISEIEPLSELPCEVQIKEEPSDIIRQDENSLIDEQDGESTDNDDDDDDNDNGEINELKSGKKTSILEQVLTGNLTINDCKEMSPKTKLTSEWWCSPCNNYYRTKEGLVKHMQLYCPRSYTCGKCARTFESVEELAKHEGTDHLKITLDFDESMKECHQCDREFVSWEMLRHHRMRDHIASSIELGTSTWCHICNRFFPNLDDYHNHLQLHETEALDDNLKPEKEFIEVVPKVQEDLEGMKKEHFIKSIKSLTCPTCGKVCTQQSALSNHMRTHEPKKHKCEECGRSFGLLIRLETHKLSEHNHQTILSPPLTSFEQEEALNAEREAREAREAKMKGNRCRKYSETLDDDEAMLDQPAAKRAVIINPKSSKNVARCGICQQWFNDHTTMLTHLQTHSDNFISKNFSCNFCKKSFREKWQLQRHEVSHKRSKMSNKKEKASYESMHTVDKTYHCPKCNKIFFKEFSLITHQCSPAFSKRNSSSTKTKTKVPIPPVDGKKFKCSKCPESFLTSQARASHMRVHAEPKASRKKKDDNAEEMPMLMPETSPGTSIPILEPKVEIQEQDPPAPVKRTLIRTANGYRCGVCQSPFVLRELAVAHLRSAHPLMPYQCPYCKERFTTQYTFTHHIKTEHPGEPEK